MNAAIAALCAQLRAWFRDWFPRAPWAELAALHDDMVEAGYCGHNGHQPRPLLTPPTPADNAPGGAR